MAETPKTCQGCGRALNLNFSETACDVCWHQFPRPRSLFWRTLQVAGADALRAFQSVAGWIRRIALVAFLLSLAYLVAGVCALLFLTPRLGDLVLRLLTTAYLIAFWVWLIFGADLRDWWSRCRARAQGAE